MRVLITGATGLIGKAITALLHERDIDVNYLTTSEKKIETKNNYKGFLWNPGKGEINEACFDEVEAIIHLAGASIAQKWTDDHKQKIIESRIESAKLLYQSLSSIKHKVAQFISASAIGAYPSSFTYTYGESFPDYNPSFLGEVVKKWEEAANLFSSLDIVVTKIRVGVVLAKEDGALPQFIKPVKFYVGAPLGSGKQWQSWIHIDDLAGIFTHCLQYRLIGIYNACAPYPVTNDELTKEVAKVLNKPLWLPNVPQFALKAALGEMSAIVLESQLVSSDKIISEGYIFKFEKIIKALENLLK
ncbi:MAG: TIGR01777 family oxidoreductase [Leeuwenhoekiella sp.]